jgi:hypothetical protein
MDKRSRLEVQVEEMIINCCSSRVCANEIVQLVINVITGLREPKEVSDLKPWAKYAVGNPQETDDAG